MITVALKPKGSNDILDPSIINYTNEFHLLENLTRRLVSIDEKGEIKLELASKIEKVSDTEYIFEIREAFFCNGDKIELSDVKNTLERAMERDSTHTLISDVLKSVEIQKNSIKLNLKKKSKSLFYYLSLPDLGILHKSVKDKKEILASDFSSYASGPYCYKIVKSENYLERNKFFPSLGSAPIKIKLINPFEKDIAKMILSGDIDLGQVSYNSFFENKDSLLNSEDVSFLGNQSDALTYIFFNRYSSKYKDIKIRKKIFDIISSRFKIPSDFNNLAKKSVQYFSQESRAFVDELEFKKKADLIENEQAPLKLTIHTYTTAYNVTLEPLINSLKEIKGLDVEVLDDVPPQDYNSRIKDGKIDLFLGIMSTDLRMPVEAINFEYLSPNAKFKDFDGEIKKLYNIYDQTFDPQKENEVLKLISRKMNEHYQFIPLFHAAIPFFYRNTKISLNGLSHLYILNFDKLELK